MDALKTALHDALEKSEVPLCLNPDAYDMSDGVMGLDLDRLAKAVTNHVLDREKVRGLIAGALIDQARANKDYWMMGPNVVRVETDLNVDDLADRLIEGLTGKAGDA